MVLPAVLDDLLVLDLSQGIAGPLCARLLGDYGADVIKLEPPGGECGRRMPPFFQDDPDPEKSLFFLLANLNKRGVTLDLTQPEGAEIFRRLARTADVIVESFAPGYLAVARARSCDAGAGQSRPGDDLDHAVRPDRAVQPLQGLRDRRLRDQRHHGDQRHGGPRAAAAWRISGACTRPRMNGMLATNVALLTRDLNGLGQHVDVSMQDVVTSSLVINQPYYSFAGGVQGRRRPEGSSFGHVTPCKDGYFVTPGGRRRHLGRDRGFLRPRGTERASLRRPGATSGSRPRTGCDHSGRDQGPHDGRDVQNGVGAIPHAAGHRADAGGPCDLRTARSPALL